MEDRYVDPITFEIVRHRLWQITDEMGISLERVSGSPVVTEAGDFLTALFLADGNPVISGTGIPLHWILAGVACKHILQRYSEDPGIGEGDIFFFNEPYLGAIHAPDALIIGPIHHKGELIGWTGTMCHLMDIGAIDAGGICPNAKDIFQEGFRTPGIKIVEGGRIRRDVLDTIANMVRDPGMVLLDIKAQIAASEVAKERMRELIDRYGMKTIRAVMNEMIEYSERGLRARLRELPDGVWQVVEYLDHDGVTDKIYKIMLELTKEGENITFDFTGTSEQAPGPINVTYYGTTAAVLAMVGILICYHIPWNQGIINTVKVIVPEGTWLNPKFPAPVSMSSSVGGAMLACHAASLAISRMLNSSDTYYEDGTAVWGGGILFPILSGINKDGKYFVSIFMDLMASGGGARTFADGVDTGGLLLCPGSICPNVERMELMYPILYLFRRQRMDSGGCGKYRGGVGGEYAFSLYDSPTGKAAIVFCATGVEPAISIGLCGGHPGTTCGWDMLRGSDLWDRIKFGEIPEHLEELKGVHEALPAKGVTEISQGDVILVKMGAGGGYGDPLERDPELVRQDVIDELVSLENAQDIYGVVIDPNILLVDRNVTEQQRTKIRTARLEGCKAKGLVHREREDMLRLTEYLGVIDTEAGRVVGCRRCGYKIGPVERNYKEYAAMQETPLENKSERFVLREFYCPGCGVMFEVEMTLKDSPFIWDGRLSSG